MKRVGAILAAGASKRFGPQNKLLAPYKGKALLCHALNAMAGADLEGFCVIVADDETASLARGTSAQTILIEPANQSQSLKTAVNWAMDEKADALLVALGDMPRISTEILNALLDKSDDGAVTACGNATFRAPPACFPAQTLPSLLALEGDKGAGKIINVLPATQILQVPLETLWDVDEPADLSDV